MSINQCEIKRLVLFWIGGGVKESLGNLGVLVFAYGCL